MKLRLHCSGFEMVEVIDPKSAAPVVVVNVRLALMDDGHDAGVFAATPSGCFDLNNLDPEAAKTFRVGGDYELTAVAPAATPTAAG